MRTLKQKNSRRYKHTLSIEYVEISRLRPNANNPRIHSDKQIQQIARSIAKFGFNVPLLVDQQLNLIAGHGRLAGAEIVGLKSIPVIRLEHLDENQRRAFLIADNRLTENAEWNNHLLGEQLKFLAEAEIDFTLEITGFEMGEIDCLIEGLDEKPEGADPADQLPEQAGKPHVSKAGDLWILDKHRVLCGNALRELEVARLMGKQKASAVIEDPPFNVRIDGHASGKGKIHHPEFAMASGELSPEEFTRFLTDALRTSAAFSGAGSFHFIFMDWRHLAELLAAGTEIFGELFNLCVWTKDNAGMGSFYRSQHELIFVFKKGSGSHRNNVQLGSLGRYRTNVWRYPGINSFGRSTSEGNLFELHPTVKPVALVADAILDCTVRGEVVLDPFLGSGTTVIAAERTSRICYGLEISPMYVDTIIRRWQSFSGKSATHQQSGKTFREIEEASHAA